ncbi:MAG: hypothetical protein BWX88_04443 [Planctomycetes bacterium ADurb.Bin126]|nr:MAG: hypothetical protein BWX88_04443 [Planctomycetes bacterium ADurb.Bin126]HOD82845.1 hypothetical protein [Phycisphaerae bacterium]HQL75549.1 hypothetical protein [Phycisphaerae bacterium]
MWKNLPAVVVVSLVLGAARADEITVKGFPPYSGVQIINVEKGMISFRVAGRNLLARPIAEVERVQITGVEPFNEAEKAISPRSGDPDWPKAVKGYDAITDMQSRPWLKRLVQYRRLRALDQTAQFDRAVQEWLGLLKDEQDSAAPLVPTKAAAKGSPANQKAIALLEAARQSVEGKTAGGQAVAQALMQAYRIEGATEKADALAAELAGAPARAPGTGPKTPGGNGGKPALSGAEGEVLARIQAAETLIRPGQKPDLLQSSLQTLQQNLRRCTESDLPRALFLMGKAEILLAETAGSDKQRALYVNGGLNCMRVVAHFPDAVEASEALLLAGKANLAIGNQQAAQAAFNQVVKRYGDSQAAQEAKTLLKK